MMREFIETDPLFPDEKKILYLECKHIVSIVPGHFNKSGSTVTLYGNPYPFHVDMAPEILANIVFLESI